MHGLSSWLVCPSCRNGHMLPMRHRSPYIIHISVPLSSHALSLLISLFFTLTHELHGFLVHVVERHSLLYTSCLLVLGVKGSTKLSQACLNVIPVLLGMSSWSYPAPSYPLLHVPLSPLFMEPLAHPVCLSICLSICLFHPLFQL